MDQYIYTSRIMSPDGRFFLRAMQDNNEMPLIDIFVRESLQNSLDAGLNNNKGINVDYILGSFDRAKLNNELQGSTELLNKDFPNEQYKYLAVRDSNTIGLNGKIFDSEYKENESFGNCRKLIYEIGKPQENKEKGGSWGLGKTVYFRIGIGLVIYYSQFKDEKGKLKSRLAATLVENNTNIKYQPIINNKRRTGICWWGKSYNNDSTEPITDVEKIKEILSYFDLDVFSKDETGTIIIIPYINEEYLIKKDAFIPDDIGKSISSLYWNQSLKDSIKMSIQRWYFPRIRNTNYKYGQYLNVSVCGEHLLPKKFTNLFRILWEMYNYGLTRKELPEDSLCISEKLELNYIPINFRDLFKSNTTAGYFVYAKIPMHSSNGNNIFNIKPYYYINYETDDSSSNCPIIPFVRKPGLIINYNVSVPWLNKQFNIKDDEYIIGIFILNSDVVLKCDKSTTLEEYIRSGEKAQHTEWIDQSIGDTQLKIVDKIKRKIRDELTKTYKLESDDTPILSKSDFRYKFSKLLPPINFGRTSLFSEQKESPIKSKPNKKSNNTKLILNYEDIVYAGDTLTIKGQILVGKSPGNITLYLTINSEGTETTLQEWVDSYRLEAPFEIKKITMSEDLRCNYKKSNNKKVYACIFDAREFNSDIIDIEVQLRIYKQDFLPSLKINETKE